MDTPKTLFLGFGNIDRQDDGVAWHTLAGIAEYYSDPICEPDGEFHSSSVPGLDYLFVLQLAPEMSEDIARYDRVCFIDAHTGAIPRPVQMVPITHEYQKSPFTHHLSAQTLLELTKSLYLKEPQAVLLSIRGYKFGFSQELSRQTKSHVDEAVVLARQWLEMGVIPGAAS